MLKHPNYTFFISDKRLYTLFKGITVTPRFVRTSSVSSHGRAPFTRGAPCLSFVRHPLHIRHAYVLWHFSDRAQATVRAAPSVPTRTTTPARPSWVPEAPRVIRFRPPSERTQPVAFSTHPHLRHRRHVAFGAATGNCTCKTALTWFKQC
jgi:hypothetical protein